MGRIKGDDMWKSVRLLTWLSLCNLFGFNEARYGKDQKKRNRLLTLGIAYLILGGMLVFYVGAQTYGFLVLGLEAYIPLYLSFVIAMLTFVFTVFRAGSDLFSLKRYEMLSVLPVSSSAIVISRFLTVYVTELVISLTSTLTVMAVCAFTAKLSLSFYITMFLGAWILPLLPMTLAMLIGTGIYAVTSRMKRKNIMQILFSLAFFFAYFYFIQSMETVTENTEEMVLGLVEAMASLQNMYPPAMWFANGVWGNIPSYLLFFGVSFAVFAVFAFAVGKFYRTICTGLASSGRKRNYVMREQKTGSAFKACFFREQKRYFASSVYVMNTAIGYIMAIGFSAMIAFGEGKMLFEQLPSSFTAKLAPFVLAMICNISPSSTSAFSMEGKHFWLTQTLPVRVCDIVNAKLAVTLMLSVPSMLVSSVILMLAIRPVGLDILWLILIPLVYAVFGSILGLFVNAKMPMMHWDHEAQPVKQSKAVLVMMLVSAVAELAPILPLLILEGAAAQAWLVLVITALCALSALLYRKLCAIRLTTLAED